MTASINMSQKKNDCKAEFTKTDCFHVRINEVGYIALFVVNGSIKKLFSVDYANIYLFSIFVQ